MLVERTTQPAAIVGIFFGLDRKAGTGQLRLGAKGIRLSRVFMFSVKSADLLKIFWEP
jgi:hypothetical protein